jgi:hypothetical protein
VTIVLIYCKTGDYLLLTNRLDLLRKDYEADDPYAYSEDYKVIESKNDLECQSLHGEYEELFSLVQ